MFHGTVWKSRFFFSFGTSKPHIARKGCVSQTRLFSASQFHFAWQLRRLELLSFILRCRCSTWSSSVSFCVAGAALGASHFHFGWQMQHLEHIQRGCCILQSKCRTWSCLVSFCVAGAALGDIRTQNTSVSSSAHQQPHHQQNGNHIINTTPSTST